MATPRITDTTSISKTGNTVTITMTNAAVYTVDVTDDPMIIKDGSDAVVTPSANTNLYKDIKIAYETMKSIH